MIGAGAWNLPPFYGRPTMGNTLVPATGGVEDAARRRLAGGAIQRELVVQAYLPTTAECKGIFGPRTELAIQQFQRDHGLVPDGQAGRKTLQALCFKVVDYHQRAKAMAEPWLAGLLQAESLWDPGAEGADTTYSTDRGLAQISRESHPDVSDTDAWGDIRYSVRWAIRNLVRARPTIGEATYVELGRWDLAVAHHNSPALARRWLREGRPPYVEGRAFQIATYVASVQRAGLDWAKAMGVS